MKKLKQQNEKNRNILNKLCNLDFSAHIKFIIGNQRKLTVDLDNKTEKINKQLEELYKLKCSSFHKRDMDLKTYNRSKTLIQKKTKTKEGYCWKIGEN